jgi:hypothetical protein
MEELLRQLVEAQASMGANMNLLTENIVQLTQVQINQQEQINTIALKQQEFDAKHLEAEQKQRETDERFNVLLEEVRYLIRNMTQN